MEVHRNRTEALYCAEVAQAQFDATNRDKRFACYETITDNLGITSYFPDAD